MCEFHLKWPFGVSRLIYSLLLCLSTHSLSPQPPPAQVAVVSGSEGVPDLPSLKMKVRSEVLPRPKRISGRRPQVKLLCPPAASSAEDKEVEEKGFWIEEHFSSGVLCLFLFGSFWSSNSLLNMQITFNRNIISLNCAKKNLATV